MLLAVEGGRFFSSSASGYSNGLNLLFLGHKKEEKPMKVTPWTQYHLVDQEPDPNPNPNPNPNQLAANKNNRCGCGCASLACFGRPDTTAARPAREVVKTASDLEKIEENFGNLDCVESEEGNSNGINVNSLKSSLKRRGVGVGVGVSVSVSNDDEVGPVENERRSVHWTDVTGGELCAIREFEPSEHSDSDDEFENSSGKTCACRIM
ncbi:uncharacterized protein LOC111891395 [Lactuca sativa]|uniref:Uncharacterized protein n=1 Tax=Lactuca sativa TaxID=4236 RepID=A0A9R1XA75_LACSA|nr:uncharacterized protein LOC111891395 [Lactuca sativa]XP_023743206.1 uncharacterized protein LOC111891395 [Lactuca sativa]XP_023743207.1 uncharacterized protein LOC111891395 [Lactuca sativa]KAJ0201167.1 hypothetical protein LSAT_V11C600336630 [Lactuca sativa]